MRIPGAITIVLATAASASAAPYRVAVCSELGNGFAIARAQLIAGTIFRNIDVRIDWHRPSACPTDAIRIDYSYQTAWDFIPEAMAYALPYEGTHIVVFYDRLLRQNGPKHFPEMLGHTMAHEIGHILQGVRRHSDTGIMKAHWTPADCEEMAFHPLAFSPLDARIIHRNLEGRQTRTVTLQ